MSRYDVEKFDPAPDPDLICCICACVLDTPQESPCRHVFCKVCIERWLDTRSNCPTCREDVQKDALRPVMPLIQNMINRLPMRCDYYDNGCVQKVLLEMYERHVKECGYALLACKWRDCDENFFRRDLDVHEATCEMREEKCAHCMLMVRVCNSVEHSCLKALQSTLKDQNDEIENLREEKDTLQEENSKLEGEKAQLQQELDLRRERDYHDLWAGGDFSNDSSSGGFTSSGRSNGSSPTSLMSGMTEYTIDSEAEDTGDNNRHEESAQINLSASGDMIDVDSEISFNYRFRNNSLLQQLLRDEQDYSQDGSQAEENDVENSGSNHGSDHGSYHGSYHGSDYGSNHGSNHDSARDSPRGEHFSDHHESLYENDNHSNGHSPLYDYDVGDSREPGECSLEDDDGRSQGNSSASAEALGDEVENSGERHQDSESRNSPGEGSDSHEENNRNDHDGYSRNRRRSPNGNRHRGDSHGSSLSEEDDHNDDDDDDRDNLRGKSTDPNEQGVSSSRRRTESAWNKRKWNSHRKKSTPRSSESTSDEEASSVEIVSSSSSSSRSSSSTTSTATPTWSSPVSSQSSTRTEQSSECKNPEKWSSSSEANSDISNGTDTERSSRGSWSSDEGEEGPSSGDYVSATPSPTFANAGSPVYSPCHRESRTQPGSPSNADDGSDYNSPKDHPRSPYQMYDRSDDKSPGYQVTSPAHKPDEFDSPRYQSYSPNHAHSRTEEHSTKYQTYSPISPSYAESEGQDQQDGQEAETDNEHNAEKSHNDDGITISSDPDQNGQSESGSEPHESKVKSEREEGDVSEDSDEKADEIAGVGSNLQNSACPPVPESREPDQGQAASPGGNSPPHDIFLDDSHLELREELVELEAENKAHKRSEWHGEQSTRSRRKPPRRGQKRKAATETNASSKKACTQNRNEPQASSSRSEAPSSAQPTEGRAKKISSSVRSLDIVVGAPRRERPNGTSSRAVSEDRTKSRLHNQRKTRDSETGASIPIPSTSKRHGINVYVNVAVNQQNGVVAEVDEDDSTANFQVHQRMTALDSSKTSSRLRVRPSSKLNKTSTCSWVIANSNQNQRDVQEIASAEDPQTRGPRRNSTASEATQNYNSACDTDSDLRNNLQTFQSVLEECANSSDSDASWVPEGQRDSDISISEEYDTDSSYEVKIPKTTAQLLAEYDSEEWDSDWNPRG